MQDFPDDESPWGRHSPEDQVVPSFSIADDVATPWGGISDNDEDEDNHHGMTDSYNPYGSALEGSHNVVIDDTVQHSASPSRDEESVGDSPSFALPTSAGSMSGPELKPVPRRARNPKKNRAGIVKVEPVGDDPLSVDSSQLDDVALTSSLASTSLQSQHETETEAGNPWNQEESNPLDSVHDSSKAWSDSSTQNQVRGAGHSEHKSGPVVPPDFEISVSDPATVGELSNAHTEYTVLMTTTNAAYEVKEAAVQRRYRDFRWLYRTLEHNHPGIVVPPPPEKQALGRFNDDFVQFRRAALEQMLIKVTNHPALKADKDLQAFLTSSDFAEYMDSRLKSDSDLKNATLSAYNSEGDSNNAPGISQSGGTFGFIGSLTGALMLSRGTEADPWTVEKRLRLGELEASLKEVIKDFIAVSQQRQQLGESLREYANVIRVLCDIEATRRLSTVLRSFAKVHDRLAQIAERQRKQDIMNLGATLDEHLRLIGSVKDAISARQKVFSAAEEAASELEKKQQALDKLIKYGSTQQDRQMGLEQDIAELSKKASDLHQNAGTIAHLVESEINRITDEKIAEFRNSVELYLESTIEAHKETIEVWETFYTRNFATKS